jgi:ligand-binding sensor domain-containing protein/AraC-like DNA-binding protein
MVQPNSRPLACIAAILLLAPPFNSIAQDTALIAFRYFPLPILSLVRDKDGTIWFNTAEDLYRLEDKGFKWEKKLDERKTLVLKEGKLTKFTALWDGSGKVLNPPWDTAWAYRLHSQGKEFFSATDKRGVTWVTSGEGFYGFKITPFLKKSLSGHSLRAIYSCGNDLYVNSYSGLFKNGTLLPEKTYSSGNSLCMGKGELWIASRHILRLDMSRGQFSLLPYGSSLKAPDGEFTYIHQSENGTIWAGHTKGLFQIVNDSVFGTDFAQPIEYVSSKNNLLYIAGKYGIFIGNGRSFSAVQAFPAFSYNSIQKIGDTWWACSKNGIWRWKEGEKQAKKWFANLPFGKLETYGILRDNRGYYWVSSSSGLHRFREDNPMVESYLTSVEFNKRSFTSIRDSFYFGSVNGLFSFNPLAFPPIDAQVDPTKRHTPIYLLAGALLLSVAVASVFYRKWRNTQLRLESIQLDQLNKEPDPFLADLETYIWNNIPTVTVASLSEFSGLSERAFYRFLQENYQIKPGTMIRDIKLKKMQQLCTEYPDISREQLANALGYSISNIIRLQGESSKLRDIEE